MVEKPGTRYAIAIIAAVVVVLLAANAFISSQTAKREGRKLCSLVITLDDAYRQAGTQPQTAIGRQVAENVHQLRLDLGCGTGDKE